jgi:hypothetical protein
MPNITIAEVVRDYETDGVPSSGPHKPKKSDWRKWGAWVEQIITAFTSNGGLIYSSLASLNADLAHGANSMAWVIGDPVVANNGVYGKVGASGAGSWSRRSDLPFSFIIASDVGAGTPNAIHATTSIPVSGSALVWMNIADTNTGSPVTVSFNGGSALTIKTNGGNNIAAGGLVSGMIVMGIASGSTFRLVSDQASAAIVAAAEAAADRAEAAALYVTGIDTVALAEAETFSDGVRFLQILGRSAYGDGGAFKAVRITEDGSPLGPGQLKTNGGTVRWENIEKIVVPAMFASIEEFFKFTKATLMVQPGEYTFTAPIDVPAGSRVIWQDGAILSPNFNLTTSVERATPYFKINYGCTFDRIDLRLPAGINTVRTLVEVNGSCDLGLVNLESADPNNNRVSTGGLDAPFLENGAIVYKGDGIHIRHLRVKRFDRCQAYINASNVVVDYVEFLEHIMASYGHGSRHLKIGGGYGTGMSLADAATMGRGPMTPGANFLLWAGCEHVDVYGTTSYDALEHAYRVGAISAGTTVANDGITYHGCNAVRPYGCGFKQDDGDAGLIRRIRYLQPYTEDVGHDNWFGNVGYQNWSSGGVNNPAVNNDGNKQAIAIRNTQFVTVIGHRNKANQYANSGYFSFWIEKSSDVLYADFDIQDSKDANLILANNGSDINRIQIRSGRIAFGGNGGLVYIPGSNHICRGLEITDIKSLGNTGTDIDFQARPDAASPFVSTDGGARVEGRAANVSIAGAIFGDADFFSEITIGQVRAIYDPASLADGAGITTTLTVTGAATTDYVQATFSGLADGILTAAWVSAANTVSVRFQNESGAAVDMLSGAVRVTVTR